MKKMILAIDDDARRYAGKNSRKFYEKKRENVEEKLNRTKCSKDKFGLGKKNSTHYIHVYGLFLLSKKII